MRRAGSYNLLQLLRFQIRYSGQSLIVTAFNSVNASTPSWPSSRPQPDCLKPPHGRLGSKTSEQFTHTAPAFSAFANRNALEMSRHQRTNLTLGIERRPKFYRLRALCNTIHDTVKDVLFNIEAGSGTTDLACVTKNCCRCCWNRRFEVGVGSATPGYGPAPVEMRAITMSSDAEIRALTVSGISDQTQASQTHSSRARHDYVLSSPHVTFGRMFQYS